MLRSLTMFARTLPALALALALSACGYKGPLSLPKPPSAPAQTSAEKKAQPQTSNPAAETKSIDSAAP
jgi:predicted small lipoprotein YifL